MKRGSIYKLIAVAFAIGAAALLWWVKYHQEAGEYESAKDRRSRWQKQAESAARAACSNELGFYRIASLHTFTHEDNPAQWSADATVEVINGANGVTRKTLQLKVGFSSGNIYFRRHE